jgi:hypothetical protein
MMHRDESAYLGWECNRSSMAFPYRRLVGGGAIQRNRGGTRLPRTTRCNNSKICTQISLNQVVKFCGKLKNLVHDCLLLLSHDCLVMETKISQSILNKKKENGRDFLALGCKCSLYFKCNLNIFWIVKINWKNILHVHLHNQCMSQVVSRKSDSSRGPGKKTKFDGKIRVCTRLFFVFLLTTLQIMIYHKTWSYVCSLSRCTREIFIRNFSHFQIYFLNKGTICTLDQICLSKRKQK